MFGIGPMELVVIVVVALLIFGPQRLPELARTLGKGLAEFRRASNELRQTLALDELQNDLRKTMNQPASPATPRPAQAGDSLPAGPAGASAPSAEAAANTTPPWQSHPGELPLDRDQEHNDLTPEESPRLAAADPGLGNVPVTGAEPSGTRRG